MHSKLTKFLCLQLQFIPDLSRFSSTNCQQTELLKKSNAASISGSFRHVVLNIGINFVLKGNYWVGGADGLMNWNLSQQFPFCYNLSSPSRPVRKWDDLN